MNERQGASGITFMETHAPPSSMISLNMPVITERQEDPLHMKLQIRIRTHNPPPLPLLHTHTHTQKKEKKSNTFHLLSPSWQVAKLHINLVQCLSQSFFRYSNANTRETEDSIQLFKNQITRVRKKKIRGGCVSPNQGKGADVSYCKLKLPPHGCMPPPTSQAAVHIHVSIFSH